MIYGYITVFFFESVSGYPLSPSPDGNLLIKAINRGWQVKVIPTVFFIEERLGGSKIGMWESSILRGKYLYELGYSPLLAYLNFLYSTLHFPPIYQLIPNLIGYFSYYFMKKPKNNDQEILNYYSSVRPREVLNFLMHLLLSKHFIF